MTQRKNTVIKRNALMKNPLALRSSLLLALSLGWTIVAAAQTSPAPQPPYAQLQNSGLVAAGNTISLTRIPVVVGAATTIYKDMILQFDVDGSGNFTLSPGFPQITDSPSMLVSSIVPGKYVLGKYALNVTGPAVLSGGVLAYSITMADDANGNTYPSQATFYVGALDKVPIADRIKKAGITSTAWNYGLASGNNCCSYWPPANMLIGVSQIGNTLTIASFSTGWSTTTDKNAPTDQIIYTLAK
jgi:hypothetical protein